LSVGIGAMLLTATRLSQCTVHAVF
jgi:hypothetical protein